MPGDRYGGGSETSHRCANGHDGAEDPAEEMVSDSRTNKLGLNQTLMCINRYTSFKDHVSLQDYEINDGMVSVSAIRSLLRPDDLFPRVWKCIRPVMIWTLDV